MERSVHISVTTVIIALSDAKCLYLLSKISSAAVDSQFLLEETRLSPKEFYYRMSLLLRADIISKKNGKYSLSSFGKIVYHTVHLITTALTNYWRLSALDSLSTVEALPKMEYNKLLDKLISDQNIKKVLACSFEDVKGNEPLNCPVETPLIQPRNTVGGIHLG
jgi:predicted transcriptional regulator